MARLRQTKVHHGLTMTTCVSKATATLVVIDQLHTVQAAGGVAGRGKAFIEIPLAVLSNESWRAGACVAAHTVHTLSSIQTARFKGARLGSTVVHVHFTQVPMRSSSADAGEAIDAVDTFSSVQAGLRVAFINIILTVHALVA